MTLKSNETRSAVEVGGNVSTPMAPNLLKIKTVLVPIDFSECSGKAVKYAVAFAKTFGAEIALVHVTDPYIPSSEMVTVDIAALKKEMIDAAEKELKTVCDETTTAVPSKAILRVGRPFHEVIEVANELKPDLIIVGTHGRTGLSHALLGSTAERIVRHANCPVLVLRENEADFVDTDS